MNALLVARRDLASYLHGYTGYVIVAAALLAAASGTASAQWRHHGDWHGGGWHHHHGWHGGGGNVGGAIVGGLIAGAVIGAMTAPAYDAGPRPVYGSAHVRWCYNRYRSYRAADNSFQPLSGPRQPCYSPYD